MANNNRASKAHVIITMDGKQAVEVMEKLRNQAKALRDQLTDMENQGQIDTDQYEDAKNELRQVQTVLNQNKRAFLDLDDVVKNVSKKSLRDLQAALREVKKRMDYLDPEKLAAEGKDYRTEMAKLSAQYRTIDNQIGQLTGQWKRQDGAILSVIKRLTAYVSVYGGFNFVTGKLKEVFNANLQFSDSLADIKKTTGLSAAAVRELSGEIMKMDTRSAVSELHNLAYEAGRLGIGNYGLEAVLGFVRAADKLNVALKEDLGEDAIVQLTKIADVMGLVPKLGVEKSLLSIGSAINELTQNSTASGGFITDYVGRLSGIAVQAHLTIEELMALAATSDATGQEVEVSATAMNKFVVQLQTHYKTVAAAAGVSENALHSLLEQGKTMEAVIMVLEALGNKGGLSMLAPLMKDMGSDGARLTASLSTMASNIDMLKQQLVISKDAFSENISVINEFNIRNQTAAAIMDRMKNSWEKMFTNSSNEGVVKDLAVELYDLSNSLKENAAFTTTLQAGISVLAAALKMLIQMAPYLAAMFSIKGLAMFATYMTTNGVSAVKKMIQSIRLLHAANTQAAVSAATAGRAMRGFTAAMSSNVFLLVASAVAALITHLITARNELSDFEQSVNTFEKGIKKFHKTTQASVIEANTLFARLQGAAKGTEERTRLINMINQQYGDYLPNLISEKSSLEDIATAQETVNTKLRQALALKAKNAAMDEVSQQYTPKMAEQLSRIQELYTNAGITKVGENDVRFLIEQTQKYYDAGKSFEEIKKQVWTDMYTMDVQSGYKGRSVDLVKSGGLLSGQWKEIQTALNEYIRNFWNQNVMVQKVGKKYDPLIGDYQPKSDADGPYKIEEAEDEAEVNKRKRLALKNAKDEYQAVMAAIEVYYKQQEQVVNDAYLKQKITVTQREQELGNIERRLLETRIKARAALHADKESKADWIQELWDMENENLSKSEDTVRALDNLWSKELDKIGDKLRKFGQGEDDGIWKKLEEDRAKLQELDIKLRQEVEQILRKYDFTGQVTDQFIASMQKLDLFLPRISSRINAGMADAQKEAEAEMAKFQMVYDRMFYVDINTNEGMNQFKEILGGIDGLSKEYLNMSGERLKLLYYQIMEYGDSILLAGEKSRKRDAGAGLAQYKKTTLYAENKKNVENNEANVKNYEQAQALGLASDSMVQDQEVLMYQARLKAAMDYYEFLKATGRDTQEQELKLQAAQADLAAAMVAQVKEKLDVLRSYGSNLEDFGTDFGEAIFGGIEERQNAFENFVRAIGKTTQELIMNWVKQKIEHALIRRAMVQTEEDSQEEMTDVSKSGSNDAVKEMEKGGKRELKSLMKQAISRFRFKKKKSDEETKLEGQSQDAQQTIVNAGQNAITESVIKLGQEAVTAKKTQAAANVSTEAAETSAKVPMGIAGAAAKTLGELGWWGIPLVAVTTALLNGLLAAAMSKVGSLFGGGGDKEGAAVEIPRKLVTGMLTYDSGNLQTVTGDDGRQYSARVGGINGSGLVTVPTLTNVGGQPALVGEQGPEIVIGRATTRAMMESAPDLLAGLISFDKLHSGRRFRTYDDGNVQEYGGTRQGGSSATLSEEDIVRIAATVGATLSPALDGVNEALVHSAKSNEALQTRLSMPIQAVINKYGKGGLVDEVASGLEQERRSGRNDSVRRLFGKR